MKDNVITLFPEKKLGIVIYSAGMNCKKGRV